MTGTGELYVVATPIGNLEDISYRAVRVLSEADVVAAEDTRHSRVLMQHYDISTRLVALHEHNEDAVASQLVERMGAGETVALVSDAGTPLVSDPGYRLVKLAIEAGITVRAVPGPSAVTAALGVAGLATDRFVFEGFLPSKPAARQTQLGHLRHETRTLVLFESSHRIEACLADLASVFGGSRQAAVCREMTKRFETILRGSLAELAAQVAAEADQRKGEFVLVVAGAEPDADAELTRAQLLANDLQAYLSASQAARVAAKIHGVNRRELYALLESAQSPS